MVGCQRNNSNSLENYSDGLVLAQDTTEFVDTLNSETRLLVERGIVLERVKSIFGVVKAEYMSRGGVVTNDMFDRNYCSKSWNDLLMAVRAKENATCTLFFEIDHWSLSREPGFVTFDEFEVTSIALEPQKFASVTFTVYDAESYTPGRLDLVYENGRWVIDNFYDFKYRMNVRQSMYDYLDSDLI